MTSYKIGTLKWDGGQEDRVEEEEEVWKEIALKTFDKGTWERHISTICIHKKFK